MSLEISLLVDLCLQVLHTLAFQLPYLSQPKYLTLPKYLLLRLNWRELFDDFLYLPLLVLQVCWERGVLSMLRDVLKLCACGYWNLSRLGLDRAVAVGGFGRQLPNRPHFLFALSSQKHVFLLDLDNFLRKISYRHLALEFLLVYLSEYVSRLLAL